MVVQLENTMSEPVRSATVADVRVIYVLYSTSFCK